MFVLGLGWILLGVALLLTFWVAAGQTPGMRFLSIRIEDYDGSPRLGPRRACRRLVGLVLAVIPFGLGLLGIMTRDDRRGFARPARGHRRRSRVDTAVAPWSQGPIAANRLARHARRG